MVVPVRVSVEMSPYILRRGVWYGLDTDFGCFDVKAFVSRGNHRSRGESRGQSRIPMVLPELYSLLPGVPAMDFIRLSSDGGSREASGRHDAGLERGVVVSAQPLGAFPWVGSQSQVGVDGRA